VLLQNSRFIAGYDKRIKTNFVWVFFFFFEKQSFRQQYIWRLKKQLAGKLKLYVIIVAFF